MLIFICTLLLMLLVIGLMSISILLKGKPIKGSCGGMASALGDSDYECPICGVDRDQANCIQQTKD